MNNKRFGLCWVIALTTGLALLGCGNGNGNGEGQQFAGKVINFASGRAAEVPVPGLTVKALDDTPN